MFFCVLIASIFSPYLTPACLAVHDLLISIFIRPSSDAFTRFTDKFVTVFFCIIYSVFIYGFDLLATATSFCYNLFSHIRSFTTSLIKAAVGVRPVCGLFYYTKLAEVVNVF
jgi:hypothetical protein